MNLGKICFILCTLQFASWIIKINFYIYREHTGRLKAALNLVKNGINNLIVIGGDGSLTGANQFRLDWESLINELLQTGQISKEEMNKCKSLHITGMVSIDYFTSI